MVNLHDTGTANTEATDPNKIYICKNCKVPLANEDDIVSRVGIKKAILEDQ